MQDNILLTEAEKARLMHNLYNREWARKNKEKVKQSRIKSLAKKYDQLMENWEKWDNVETESAGESNE